MNLFSRFSIRKKLMGMSLLSTGVALTLACSLFIAFDFIAFQNALVKSVSALADVVAVNSASAIVFNDRPAAQQTLSTLKARPAIIQSVIYTPEKQIFTRWQRSDLIAHTLPPAPLADDAFHRLGLRTLAVYRPIFLDQTRIGTLFIESDLNDLYDRFIRYFSIAAATMLLSVLVAALVAYRVGKKIAEPILHLVKLATTVSETKNYNVRSVPESEDEVGLLSRTFNDMLTKIQHDAQSLQKAHNELESRVEERTAELTAANKELEAYSYSVSHDLRTPLRAIDGFSREVMENSPQLSEQGKLDLSRIRAATQRMGQLIDDLLKLSQVRGEMQHDEVSLSAIAERIVRNLKEAQPHRHVDVYIQPNLQAMGDLRLLRVALDNLLGNAWKFTEKTLSPRIELRQIQKDGKTVFVVKDNGAGFNMAYSHKLFGVFQRLHDNREFSGTGVGLATVQRIIHRHGGEIWAEAEINKGATFYFTIPDKVQPT